MKLVNKTIVFFAMLITMNCSVCNASELQRVETLASKAILKNSNGYFILSDVSFWKVITFVKRTRTLSEWWNSASLIPEHYECVPSDWYTGAEIQVFSKNDHLEVDLANAKNEKVLRQCTHLLYNSKNGQILFAISMQPSEFLDNFFYDVRKEGSAEGYKVGYDEGLSAGRSVGYSQGHSAGHAEGLSQGMSNASMRTTPTLQ